MFQLVLTTALLAAAFGLPNPQQPGGRPIVGGEETTIEKYPHQISMEKSGWSGWSHACGGSILNEYFILTAAHCIANDYSAAHNRIRVGSTVREEGGSVHKVEAQWYHSQFNMKSLDNDVAILKLKTPITFSDKAKPVKLIGLNQKTKSGDLLDVSGWGALYSGAYDLPTILNHVKVPAISQEECSDAYHGFNKITSRMLCATAPGKDSCQGDSGGPVINENGQQVGIVSWGKGCALPGYPGVYTNVADEDIQTFIKQHVSL